MSSRIVRTNPARSDVETTPGRPARWRRRVLLASAALVVLGLVGGAWWGLWPA